MTNEEMLAALAALPAAEMLTTTTITDPLGSGAYYSARTVVKLLDEQRNLFAVPISSPLGDELDGVDDLALFVVRLARCLKKAEPDNNLPDLALDYLKKHGFYKILRKRLDDF